MANLKQLSDLRTAALRLADVENQTLRFSTSELNGYVNAAIRHVVAEMITQADKPFFSKEVNIVCGAPVFGQVPTYPLPSDFLRVLSVGWASNVNGVSGGPWMPLEPCTDADIVQLRNAFYYGGVGPLKYYINGGPTAYTQSTLQVAYSISILPNPTNASLLWIRYVPQPPELVNDTDTFDGMLGFEDAVTTWAAILIKRKDELDTSDLERDMLKHFSRIRMIAKRRDGSRPPRTSIVRGRGPSGMGRRRGGSGWGVW